ncbi:MAG: hypothetical protein KAH32_03520 [Chlamydiia bacterium]|nr:hypothetical protein [Chlamydiia bacterium]
MTISYRRNGRVGSPWKRSTIKLKRLPGGYISLDFSNKPAELAMNFYRKHSEYIVDITNDEIVCMYDILFQQHIHITTKEQV